MKHNSLLTAAIAVLLLLPTIFPASAQDSVQARDYINHLASPEMHGRGYAYHGDSIAANYVREQFKRIGLQPFASNDYYNRYFFDCYAMEGTVSAALDGQPLTPWQQFSFASYSASADGSYTLLPITVETVLDTVALRKFCAKNHKWMNRALLYVDMEKCKDKEAKNRLSRFIYNLIKYNGRWPFKGFVIGVQNIPVWSFSAAHRENTYVLTYLKNDCKVHKNSQLSLLCHNRFYRHHTQNVCAMIRGSEVPDSIVVIGGHYDHLGQMGEEVIFTGAHDNASGTAAVLDMAQYFKTHAPRYTTIFVLFSGEEAGLLGSQHFVKDSLFDFSKVKLMLNMDLMCGGDDGFTVVNSDGENTKAFYQSLVDRNNELQRVKKVAPRTNANISDHAPFILKGMPAVFIYTMGGKTGGYHQPDDTSENASLSCYNDIVSLLIWGVEKVMGE